MEQSSPGSVRYDDYHYEIDDGKTSLIAIVCGTELFWRAKVATHDNPAYEDSDEAPLANPSMEITFRDTGAQCSPGLSGRQMEVCWDENYFHPILPDNPANVYIGYHLFPHRNALTFGEIDDDVIEFKWECWAREGSEALFPEEKFLATGRLKFRHADIHYGHVFEEQKHSRGGFRSVDEFDLFCREWQPDYDDALLQLKRFFDPADFGSPQHGLFSVIFPVRLNS